MDFNDDEHDKRDHHDEHGQSQENILNFRQIAKKEKIEIFRKEKKNLQLDIPSELEKLFLETPFDSKQGMIEKMILLSHYLQEHGDLNWEIIKQYFQPQKSNVILPLYASTVSCAFTSPADDYIENHISLDAEFVRNPSSTFFVRANGDCMRETIKSGDLLIIDRSVEVKEGKIALVVLNGEFTVKRVCKDKDGLVLRPDNPLYTEIRINPESDFTIWGAVVHIIHTPD